MIKEVMCAAALLGGLKIGVFRPAPAPVAPPVGQDRLISIYSTEDYAMGMGDHVLTANGLRFDVRCDLRTDYIARYDSHTGELLGIRPIGGAEFQTVDGYIKNGVFYADSGWQMPVADGAAPWANEPDWCYGCYLKILTGEDDDPANDTYTFETVFWFGGK